MRRNKYGVSPVAERTFRDTVYASKAEMLRARELRMLAGYGIITNLIEQKTVYMTLAKIMYVVDFYYEHKDDGPVYEEIKGMATAMFRLKARLWPHYGPAAPLRVLTRKGDRWTTKTIPGKESNG